MRRNPNLRMSPEGYLMNRYGGDIWIHTTDKPAQNFLQDGFEFPHDAFYISDGEDCTFGQNMIAIKYRPTKLFDPESRSALSELMRCMRSRISGDELLAHLTDCEELEYFEFGDEDSESVFDAFSDALRSGSYEIYESIQIVRECLTSLGYTAQLECEDSFRTSINVAVFRQDFSRMDIVGAVDLVLGAAKGPSNVTCPTCGAGTSYLELARTIRVQRGPVRFVCKRCQGD